MKTFAMLRVAVLAMFCAIHPPGVFAQGGRPVFQPRYVPPVSATPAHRAPPSEPIPRGWIIGGAALVFLAGCGLLFAASKAWRAAHVFEGKCRFPIRTEAALRFGGNRSGGLMASIDPVKKKENA